MSKVKIETKDGTCPSYVYRPTSSAPRPAVLIFMDGLGIRPAMLEIGERLATYQAKHGWVLRDTPAYDAVAAERHWQTLSELFDATLKR